MPLRPQFTASQYVVMLRFARSSLRALPVEFNCELSSLRAPVPLPNVLQVLFNYLRGLLEWDTQVLAPRITHGSDSMHYR